MRLHTSFIAALAVAAAAACGRADLTAPSPPGSTQPRDTVVPEGYFALTTQGMFRAYRLHRPDPARTGKLPLLIALHGATDNAANFERGTGLDSIADREGFVVAYPDGVAHMWNAGGPYEQWLAGVNDVAFISDLIDTLATRYPIERGRVFVTGHSNGGYLAYRLAHELSYKLTGVAPVGASEIDAHYRAPTSPVALLHLHARDDATVPMAGKDFYGSRTLPVETVLTYWRWIQGCGDRPDTLLATADVLGLRWRSASGHGDVAQYTVALGGHTWFTAGDGSHLPASEVIWSFFRSVPTK